MSPAVQPDGVVVVLVATRNPLNIGAAARAMSNFGFLHLRVVNPYEVAFREARSAVGALPLLQEAQEYASVAEAVADCTLVAGTTSLADREALHPVYALDIAVPFLQQRTGEGGRIALLFGSEKIGLSNQDLSHCHCVLRIPTRVEHSSMNLGQAVAVCLYELIRSREPEPASAGPAAQPTRAEDLERITALLLDALRASSYASPAATATLHERVRRMVLRLALQAEDAQVLQGMLRRIVWKLRHCAVDPDESY